MIAFLFRGVLVAALRRAWAQRSKGWLAVAVVVMAFRLFDGGARRRLTRD